MPVGGIHVVNSYSWFAWSSLQHRRLLLLYDVTHALVAKCSRRTADMKEVSFVQVWELHKTAVGDNFSSGEAWGVNVGSCVG
jgi:hypothetical protein